MSFTQPTSATSGLAPYGGDGSRKRMARKHRAALLLRKYEDTTMKTYEELLGDLQKAVNDALNAPEGDRDEILNKAFGALDEGLTLEVQAAVEEGIMEANPLVEFTENLAKSAGEDDELAKGLTDVADFAYALQSVERMMERMAAIQEGNANFPSLVGSELNMEDREAQKEHAAAILDIIAPYYSMGLVVLQRLTGATVDEGTTPEAEDDFLKADMAQFFAGVANADITFEQAGEALAKAFPPADGAPPADGSAATSPDDPEDGMDDSDVDPIETVIRLASAIILQMDAVRQSDGGEDPDADPNAPPATGAPTGAASVAKADIATMMKSEVENQLGIALKPLAEENAALRAQVEALGKRAAPTGNEGIIDPEGRNTIGEGEAERLAKMDPEAARAEVFKHALRNPS